MSEFLAAFAIGILAAIAYIAIVVSRWPVRRDKIPADFRAAMKRRDDRL